ncbi:MAG: DUF3552 domain-containing protein, partial [Clostridia bacterium]|nr:DUF3552 domain-containing protein [Clostridia bacterium]
MFSITEILITCGVALVLIIICAIVAFKMGVTYRKKFAEAEIGGAENEAKKIIEEARVAAENLKRELLIEAKEEKHRLRTEFDKEMKEQKAELQRQEHRIQQKEENI